MADPIKLQVLKALTAHLEGIEWNGSTLEGCVFRGRNRFGENDPETMLSLLEAPRPDIGRQGGELNQARSYTWDILLQAWTKDDENNPSDPMYFLQEAIEQRLSMIIATDRHSGMGKFPGVYRLGNLVHGFGYGPGVIRPPTDNISSKTFLYMPIRIDLADVVG